MPPHDIGRVFAILLDAMVSFLFFLRGVLLIVVCDGPYFSVPDRVSPFISLFVVFQPIAPHVHLISVVVLSASRESRDEVHWRGELVPPVQTGDNLI